MTSEEQSKSAAETTASRAASPLRGTQSFVGVMAQVWGRPGLTGLEILWRWLAAEPLLLLGWWCGSNALRGVAWHASALEEMTVFKPSEAADAIGSQLSLTLPRLWPVARWWIPLALLVWSVAAAIGRTAILRRLDASLKPRVALVGLVGFFRALAVLVTLAVWGLGAVYAARHLVTEPAVGGREPNLVLLMACIVMLTLLLFMAWSLLSWIFDALPLFVMAASTRTLSQALRDTWNARELRAKLIEINLVMGIIKVALLVLAMVFSASPLPFATVETTRFLAGWWIFVGVLYLAFSDLFQVIRRAAYLRLFQALATPENDMPQASKLASKPQVS